jgi:hypothetical protein
MEADVADCSSASARMASADKPEPGCSSCLLDLGLAWPLSRFPTLAARPAGERGQCVGHQRGDPHVHPRRPQTADQPELMDDRGRLLRLHYLRLPDAGRLICSARFPVGAARRKDRAPPAIVAAYWLTISSAHAQELGPADSATVMAVEDSARRGSGGTHAHRCRQNSRSRRSVRRH